MNRRRQTIILRIDAISQFAERIKKRRLRPLVHARHAFQAEDTFTQANQRGQEPRRSTRVTDEQLEWLVLSSAPWHPASLPINGDPSITNLLPLGRHID